MTKKKLQRFAENRTFPHYFEVPFEKIQEGFFLRGKWCESFFRNQGKLILELGCGKGEYTVGLAELFPENNYIGVDQKGARIWKGAKYVQQRNLKNVAFIRSQIGLLPYWFAEDEVDEIWITFPDPQPGGRHNKRLTSLRYLQFYKKFLKHLGKIHVKTDNDEVFNDLLMLCREKNYSILLSAEDIDMLPYDVVLHGIKTFYELMWREEGKKIKYICFTLPHEE
jgi:tRNA (guanine-N7-)-methyltransferase